MIIDETDYNSGYSVKVQLWKRANADHGIAGQKGQFHASGGGKDRSCAFFEYSAFWHVFQSGKPYGGRGDSRSDGGVDAHALHPLYGAGLDWLLRQSKDTGKGSYQYGLAPAMSLRRKYPGSGAHAAQSVSLRKIEKHYFTAEEVGRKE